MAVNIKNMNVDDSGRPGKMYTMAIPEIYVKSNEVVPKGLVRGARAFIIDKMDVAVCDGDDSWYAQDDTGIHATLAGQHWSALFGEADNDVLYDDYGVSWDLSSSNKLTRTGLAASFEDPVPSVGGSAGSSPFDNIMPWAGMKVVEDEFAGSLVSIPKFYYRIEHTGSALNINIAGGPKAGYSVSPAHMDRGDGKGERDVVYIGRYHCGGTTGQSVSGVTPLVNMSRPQLRSTFASQCESYGVTGYSMQDYAMFWTIRLLMLVEYATWDFQGAIGYGCGNGSSAEVSGSTDAMPYHTGTMADSIETYGVGVQYRYIEDMWANVAEFIDGWRCEEASAGDGSLDVYVTVNPDEYSDTEGGTLVGNIPSTANGGIISNWAVPTVEGYSWAMLPAAVASDAETGTEYVADGCGFNGPSLFSGGYFAEQDPAFGPFVLFANGASDADVGVGARLQKIP